MTDLHHRVAQCKWAFANHSQGPYCEENLLFDPYNFTHRTGSGIGL